MRRRILLRVDLAFLMGKVPAVAEGGEDNIARLCSHDAAVFDAGGGVTLDDQLFRFW